MSELFLIAHKVSGEAAFDVAIQMECPECQGHGDRNIADATFIDCEECDATGHWWIIPTSGHRAYPFHAEPLNKDIERYHEAMPPNLPDHYPTLASPTKPKLDLAALMKSAPIRRRV